MHVEWKLVTDKLNPQVTRKLKEFATMCCPCNTSPKLALRTSVTVVTLYLFVCWETSLFPCQVCSSAQCNEWFLPRLCACKGLHQDSDGMDELYVRRLRIAAGVLHSEQPRVKQCVDSNKVRRVDAWWWLYITLHIFDTLCSIDNVSPTGVTSP